ncbi:MAG: cupin domain-containing protein [Chloroflexi bacterium]|nr:cupin domain-containing protein [Chloroflexota bacterium]
MEAGAGAMIGRVVRAGESYAGKQGPNYTPGVSAQTVGSLGLWLGCVTLPPGGGRTKAHVHDGHESAFYLISGEEVELWTGDQLQHREVAQAGDFLYIPARVPHVAVNRSKTIPAVFVGARTDPNEQESVVMRSDLDGRVP